ncbi:Acg family FMN-binding oxidoreductase [Marinicellulosiphila megalodicopiae]|uniref:Acg family FMN-binding oxidoreductase n=1 Tax=Marinicellulosiphila megalodicopiae TaxID=2724896 RepID=UPI003BB1D7A4
MKRRFILKAGLGSITVLAGTGATWSLTRTPHKALTPWSDTEFEFDDVRLNCLAYAILAPSPHNRQPWKVELINDNQIDLYCDLDRRLKQTDPYDRQITIGLGCFLEQLKIAAGSLGLSTDIVQFPDGQPKSDGHELDNNPIASIVIKHETQKIDPLFNQILKRRSTKETFESERKVEPKLLEQLLKGEFHHLVEGTVNSLDIQPLKQIIFDGMAVEFGEKQALKESADLMRFGKNEIESKPDGIDLGGPLLEALSATGLLNRSSFYDPNNPAVVDYLKRLKSVFDSSNGFVWITSKQNTRIDQLNAGADYLRLNLKATQLGLAIHPVSQTLQEYKAMNELYAKIHSLLGIKNPARLQMLARIGYAKPSNPSPRWSVDTIFI